MASTRSKRAAKVGKLPPDGACIRNLGCRGGLTFQEFTELSPSERKRRERERGWPRTANAGGAELDLLLKVRGKAHGFEFKVSDAPGSSRSMRAALQDLGLEHLWVVYPGTEAYRLDDRLSVLPLRDIVGLPGRLASAENGVP